MESKTMAEQTQPLAELVREIGSDFYDPAVHGQGVVVTWHNKRKEWVFAKGVLDKLFGQQHLRHFFVQTASKPLQFKKMRFEWSEGTSDITLDLEANFNIKLADKNDAQKLVSALQDMNAVTLHEGLFQLLDQQLHNCMHDIYDACMSATPRRNLLDEFYQSDTHKGESERLNRDVSNGVRKALSNLPFAIGFTLQNAPERVADFSHCTVLKRNPSQKEFNVQSECTLKLANYQAYKKSGVASLDHVKKHMKQVIDQALHEYVSGKTLFDLFSRFESDVGDEESIATLVRARVEVAAAGIGYNVQSFYSLPDVAPLKLLNGIRIDIDEDDGAFSTGYGGGAIKINASMDVKAIDGDFNKLLHLLSPSGDYENLDVLDFSYPELVERIKKPLLAICAKVVKQQDYRLASTNFEGQVVPLLEAKLQSEMATLYGLEVSLKSVFPVETEDSNRLRELSGSSHTVTFKVLSQYATQDNSFVEFKSTFRVVGIDLENGWEAFERADFGYRTKSTKRTKFNELSPDAPDFDRQCKYRAIELELADIANEVIHLLKAELKRHPDLIDWYRSAQSDDEQHRQLLKRVEQAVKASRGLNLRLEILAIDDDFVIGELEAERKARINHIVATNKLKGEQQLIEIKHTLDRKRALELQIDTQKKSVISDIEDMAELNRIEQQIKDPLHTIAETPTSISQTLLSIGPGKHDSDNFRTDTTQPQQQDDKEGS
jgi:hypothetical protein